MTLYPNPTYDNILLQLGFNKNEIAKVEIVSATGQVVKSFNIDLRNGLNTINVGLDDLTSGVYFFRLSLSNGVQMEKIVKR